MLHYFQYFSLLFNFREARQVSITKNLEDTIPNFGSIHLLKCNCNGTKVAFTSQKVST